MTEQEGCTNLNELFNRLVARNNELKQSTQSTSLQDEIDELLKKKIKEELIKNQYLEFVNKQPAGTSKAKLNILACKEHPDVMRYMFDNDLIVVEHFLLGQIAYKEDNAPLVRFFLLEKGIKFVKCNQVSGQLNPKQREMFDVLLEYARTEVKTPLLQHLKGSKDLDIIKMIIEECIKCPTGTDPTRLPYSLEEIINLNDFPLLEWFISIMRENDYIDWYHILKIASKHPDSRVFEACKKLPRKGYAGFPIYCYNNPKLHEFMWEIRDSIEYFNPAHNEGRYDRHRKPLLVSLSGSWTDYGAEQAAYAYDTWIPYLDKKYNYKPQIANVDQFFSN